MFDIADVQLENLKPDPQQGHLETLVGPAICFEAVKVELSWNSFIKLQEVA